MLTVQRIYLGLMGTLFLVSGVYAYIDPAGMGEALGIGIVDPSGTTEIRATYGGLVVGSGLLLLSGLFSRVLAVAALAGTVFGAGGLVSTRIALEIFGGGFSANQLIVIVFEIALVSLAYALLRRAMQDL